MADGTCCHPKCNQTYIRKLHSYRSASETDHFASRGNLVFRLQFVVVSRHKQLALYEADVELKMSMMQPNLQPVRLPRQTSVDLQSSRVAQRHNRMRRRMLAVIERRRVFAVIARYRQALRGRFLRRLHQDTSFSV